MKRSFSLPWPILCLVAPAGVVLPAKTRSPSVFALCQRTQVSLSGVASLRCANSLACFSMGTASKSSPAARQRQSAHAVGVTGWVDGRYLTEPELWQRSAKLLEQAKFLPSRLAAAPRHQPISRCAGRTEPRLYQFGRGAELENLAVRLRLGAGFRREGIFRRRRRNQERRLVFSFAASPRRPPGEGVVRNSAITTTTQPAIRPFPSRAGSLPASYPLTYRMLSGKAPTPPTVRPWPGLS